MNDDGSCQGKSANKHLVLSLKFRCLSSFEDFDTTSLKKITAKGPT